LDALNAWRNVGKSDAEKEKSTPKVKKDGKVDIKDV